jgi:hypothetical protein
MDESSSEGPHGKSRIIVQSSAEDALKAHLTEFQCLRTEIQWLINNGMMFQYFAILLIGAALPTVTWTLVQAPRLYLVVVLAFSLIFSWLGTLYFWEHVEIHLVAGYLKSAVRSRVRTLTNCQDWWAWEEYKEKEWDKLGNPNLFLSRCALFLIPSFLFLVGIIIFVVYHRWSGLTGFYRARSLVLLASFFAIDCIFFLYLLHLLVFRGNLRKRFLSGPSGVDAIHPDT